MGELANTMPLRDTKVSVWCHGVAFVWYYRFEKIGNSSNCAREGGVFGEGDSGWGRKITSPFERPRLNGILTKFTQESMG